MSEQEKWEEQNFDAYQRGFAAGQAANEDTKLLDWSESDNDAFDDWQVYVDKRGACITLRCDGVQDSIFAPTLREAIRKAMERESES